MATGCSRPWRCAPARRVSWSATWRAWKRCRRLAIPLDAAALRQELLAFCAALGDGVAKLIVTRGEGLRGYAPPAEASPRRILSGSPRPAYPERHWQQGVRLFACRTRLAEQPLLAGLKHLNRLEQVLARAEWGDAGHAEGLMLDVHERVVEGVQQPAAGSRRHPRGA